MGKLDCATGYMSGSMEYATDHGVGWRREFLRLVDQSDLNIDLIDPTNKPGGVDVNIGEDKFYQEMLQKEKRWTELRQYVKKYRRYDLRFVDISDFLIVAVDTKVPQWGTANEVYMAEQEHKPMFFICEGGLSNLPRWLFDVADLDDPSKNKRCNVFESIEQVVEELVSLDNGTLPLNDEWVLVRKDIENQRSKAVNDPI